MAKRKPTVPWQRGRLVVGGLLSVALGGLTAIAGETDTRLALLVTLGSVNLTLVIDAFFRREESIHHDEGRLSEISAGLAITKSLADAPPGCHAFVREIAEQWTLIERRNSAILLKLREARQRAFTEEMRDLASGQSSLGRRQEFNPGILPELTEMTALSATGNDYWWTGRDTGYLVTERSAITANGLKLRRILVLPEAELDDAMKDVLREQMDVGIDLYVVILEEVPPLHKKCLTDDRALVTDKSGIVGVVIPGNDREDAVTDAGHFTINEDKIQTTRDILDTLAPYQVPAGTLLQDDRNPARPA
ncbi:hypothetical protein AGRA3207_000832 [Actinomadura graeca]|uniref:Uncharacterized protein n=1 Tax=Actinomadura graeca TaxID=2750812 RepID=A0ABX8QQF7_9ACTN|nr:hypothetical protein [Actinomadura graeca]QXJ20169.1 hypothetical protein AGRA3207_000832 [Actinomadura graeca]